MTLGIRYIGIDRDDRGFVHASIGAARDDAHTDSKGDHHDPTTGHVLAVNLDTADRPDGTPELRYQLAENRQQAATQLMAEMAALIVGADSAGATVRTPAVDDREKMRDVIEAMRPIVDAARDWHRWVNLIEPDTKPTRAHVLDGIIADNIERVGIAMSAWNDSQTWSEAEKLQRRLAKATECVAAMRPVVGAAMTWFGQPGAVDRFDSSLLSTTAANRERITDALAAWDDAQAPSEAERVVEAAQQWADNECGTRSSNNFGCGEASHDAECPYGIAERRLYDAVRDRGRKGRP